MSTPQRELTTELNFSLNRANLDKFLSIVSGFKVKTAAISAAVGYAVNRTLDHFTQVADIAINMGDIAASAGIATDEFAAMQASAGKLGVSTQNFQNDIKKLSTTIQQARVGSGDFFKIFTESGRKIRMPNSLLTDAENFKAIFKDIFDYINTLPTESRKLYVLSNLFSPESAARWKDAISGGYEAYERFYNLSLSQNKNIDLQIAKFKEYKKASDDLDNSWEEFKREFTSFVAPVVSGSLNIASSLIKPNTTQRNYFAEDMAAEAELLAGADSIKTIVNNFQFDVPIGTTEEQGAYMADMVKSAVTDAIDEQTRIVISNNPQME